jgi:AcrR family transcriptional regulator
MHVHDGIELGFSRFRHTGVQGVAGVVHQVVEPAAKKKSSPSAQRKPRADAQRNRESILDAAKQAFTRDGANASLDDMAKQAGVGAGTLYRHFPTRDALIEAVYRSEMDKFVAAGRQFAATLPPIEALRAWMLRFIDLIAAKQLIAPVLSTFAGDPSKLFESSRGQVQAAHAALVQRAIKHGDIRGDVDPFDLLRALIGVSHVAADPDWQQSARRLVEILIAGSGRTPSGKIAGSLANCSHL